MHPPNLQSLAARPSPAPASGLGSAVRGGRRPLLVLLLAVLTATGTAAGAEIHDAAGTGDAARVKALLSAHHDWLNLPDADGWTPLHYAVLNGATAVVEALLAAGADVQAATNEGQTPLHVARNRAMADLLLARGADLKAVNRFGETPLHVAAGAGCQDVAETLLAHGADPNARSQGGWTPLHVAVMQAHPDLVELLLSHGADPEARDRAGRTPGLLAKRSGNAALIAPLARRAAPPAPREDRDQIVARANFEKAVVLVNQRHPAEAKALIAANPVLVRMKGPNGRSLLDYAATHDGDREIVEFLVDRGADVNARDNDSRTPLHDAAAASCLEAAKVLLARGADANARNKFGLTPLLASALVARGTEMAALLLAHGADINARDDSGDTPLHASVFNANAGESLTEFLIARGADLGVRNDQGQTPLALALKARPGIVNARAVAALRAHHAPQ